MYHPLAPAPEAIALRNARVTLAGREVLADITLDLTEARIGIIGRNGSGKTTLLRLIAGLIAPQSGDVRLADHDPARDRKAMLARIGILFQNPDHQIIFPTVEEELAFGLRQLGRADPAGAARAVLDRWGRAHWAGVSVASLSQGQRQFLCLLAVLAMEPATILLDEPFSGLDLPMQARLRRELAALPQRLIVITHDPAVVAGYDRVIWLEGGRLRADGPPDAVLPDYRAEMARLGEADADTHIAL